MMRRPRCGPLRPPCLQAPLLLLMIPLLLFRVPQAACLLQQYLDCRDPSLFRCGEEEFNVSYPFLDDHRKAYCGMRDHYALSCRDGVTPVIEIGGRPYRVKRIDYDAGVLGVADLAAARQGACPLAAYDTATFDWSLFEYTGDDHNLTLYGNCTRAPDQIPKLYEVSCLALGDRRSYVINPEDPPDHPLVDLILGSCNSTAVVPLGGTAAGSLKLADPVSLRRAMGEGFNLTWMSGKNVWCGGCTSSGGACVYYSNNDTRMCFCSDSASLTSCSSTPPHKGRERMVIFIVAPIGFIAVIVGPMLYLWYVWGRGLRRLFTGKRLSKEIQPSKELCHTEDSDSDFQLICFSTLQVATNYFSVKNKLGEGGYGPVYKGKLPNEQYVAIKRLSKASSQGSEEFKSEVKLVVKLQHTNLVRLLGYCIEYGEKILVYEYMENQSLDKYIFDVNKGKLLDWPKRLRIIEGITQGLLYLHKYSRLTIVHRDLKASNILLDGEWNPKIADFGLARIFSYNDDQANTKRIIGTHGYMSPEYAMNGLFSTKSDVFSFGVLLLEILSGKKNISIQDFGMFRNLLGHAWELWQEGRQLELMDPAMGTLVSEHKSLRCFHVALLCVQESPEDRPTMLDIISMLHNDATNFPAPSKPAFFFGNSTNEQKNGHLLMELLPSSNSVTLTTVDGR